MKNKTTYVMLSLLMQVIFVTATESPKNSLTASGDELRVALQLLREDEEAGLKKSTEINAPHNTPTNTPSTPKRKDTYSITGYFVTSSPENLPLLSLYNKDVQTKVLSDSTCNLYHVSFKDNNDNQRRIVVKTDEKYDNQTHLIVSDNINREAYMIDLQQKQIAPSLQLTDTIRTSNIHFSSKPNSLSKFPHCDATDFKITENGYDIVYKDAENIYQKISLPSKKEYKQEKYAIIKVGDKQYINLTLPENKTITTESVEQPQSLKTSQNDIPQEKRPSSDDKQLSTEAETSQNISELIEDFKKIDKDLNNQSETGFIHIEQLLQQEIEKQAKTTESMLKSSQPLEESLTHTDPTQSSSTSETITQPEETLQVFKENLKEEREKQQSEIEKQRQKNQQEKLEKIKALEKRITENDKRIRNQRKTYFIGITTFAALVALLVYMYKYDKLPTILSQLPEVLSDSFKKYLPAQ